MHVSDTHSPASITDPFVALDCPKKYLTYIAMAWIACLIVTILTATKIFDLFEFQLAAPALIYPITYIFSDLFTEVYGYRQTRRIVWMGFALFVFTAASTTIMVAIPPSPDYTDNAAFAAVFGGTPLIVTAEIAAFYFGEMANSYVLAKMKVWSHGKRLWTRTVGSTIVGQVTDNFLFYFIAFGITATYPASTLVNMWLSTAAFCIAYEALATPITYRVIRFLKKAEGMDVYDTKTNFNPFILS